MDAEKTGEAVLLNVFKITFPASLFMKKYYFCNISYFIHLYYIFCFVLHPNFLFDNNKLYFFFTYYFTSMMHNLQYD